MPSDLGVVPAAAGKRLGAAVLDWLRPLRSSRSFWLSVSPG